MITFRRGVVDNRNGGRGHGGVSIVASSWPCLMGGSFEAAGAVASVSPVTKQAAVVVAQDQAAAYLALNAWGFSAGSNDYYSVSAALSESAAQIRGDHFVNFVNASGILSLGYLANVRVIRDMNGSMVSQYAGYATSAAAQTPPDTESATVLTTLSTDHTVMQSYADRLLGACVTSRWPRPMPLSQSDLLPGDPVAVGQALTDAREAARREAYFVGLCGVAAQFARMAQKEALSQNLLAFASIAQSDYWCRLGVLTGQVDVDDAVNLAAAKAMVSALATSYTSLAAAATAAGDALFASLVSAKLVEVQAIVARVNALQIP